MDEAAYPIFLRVAGWPVLVVGGGAVALRKARGLAECGAAVRAVALEFVAEFAELKTVERVIGAYEGGRMRGREAKRWRLVFAATDSAEVNAAVARDAAAAGILCCRCDGEEGGDFANGAVERIGGIVLAVGTGGAAPALARRVREQAATGIDPMLAALAELAGGWRKLAKREVADDEARHALLRRAAGEEMEACLRNEGQGKARALFGRWLEEARGQRARGAVANG